MIENKKQRSCSSHTTDSMKNPELVITCLVSDVLVRMNFNLSDLSSHPGWNIYVKLYTNPKTCLGREMAILSCTSEEVPAGVYLRFPWSSGLNRVSLLFSAISLC